MSLFDTFVPTQGQPNNLTKSLPLEYQPTVIGKRGGYPYETYDEAGRPGGYHWYYGDPVILEFELEGELTDEDAQQYIDVSQYAEGLLKQMQILDFRGR